MRGDHFQIRSLILLANMIPETRLPMQYTLAPVCMWRYFCGYNSGDRAKTAVAADLSTVTFSFTVLYSGNLQGEFFLSSANSNYV